MTSERKSVNHAIPFVPGFWPLIALGGLLGYVLCMQTGDIFTQRLYYLFGTFCAGFGWAYIFLQLFEVAGEALALLRDPLPPELDPADRDGIAAHLEKLKGRQHVTTRVRHLLRSWIQTGDARTVLELAALQGRAAARPVVVGGVFGVLMFLVGAFLYASPWLTWGGLAVLALVLFTRQTFLMQLDLYIEARLLSRLSAQIPQTAMTAKELAAALGEQIRSTMREVVPDPAKTGEAMKSAVEQVVAQTRSELEKLQQTFVQNQSALVDKWIQSAETTTADLKNVEKALSIVVNDLTAGLGNNAAKLGALFDGHNKEFGQAVQQMVEKLDAVLKHHAEMVQAGGSDWGERIKVALADSLAKFEESQRALSAQLDKIAALQESIENVLHMQQVVDGTVKTVAASEEFAKLIAALREHLQASDNLLREVSKPRRIRLIESEGEVFEESAPSA